MERDTYLEQLEVELQKWNAEAELCEARAYLAQARLRAQCDRQMEAMRDIRRRAEQQLLGIRSASTAGAWPDIERGAGHAWDELRRTYERARDEFDSVASDTPAPARESA